MAGRLGGKARAQRTDRYLATTLTCFRCYRTVAAREVEMVEGVPTCAECRRKRTSQPNQQPVKD